MNPRKPTEPLSSEEREHNREGRGTPAGGDDPHFPASEGAAEGADPKSHRRKAARVETDITLLPPG